MWDILSEGNKKWTAHIWPTSFSNFWIDKTHFFSTSEHAETTMKLTQNIPWSVFVTCQQQVAWPLILKAIKSLWVLWRQNQSCTEVRMPMLSAISCSSTKASLAYWFWITLLYYWRLLKSLLTICFNNQFQLIRIV